MGLLAGTVEAAGISTVIVALLAAVAARVRPPRSLTVPFPFGRPLGTPGRFAEQLAVVRAALDLLEHPGPAPLRSAFAPADSR